MSANSPVWLGGSILSFDYTSQELFIIIKADVLAPMQVPSLVQMTKKKKKNLRSFITRLFITVLTALKKALA